MLQMMNASIVFSSTMYIIMILIACIVTLGLTFLIRKWLKKKLKKEIELAKIISEELTEELFSDNWNHLQKAAYTNQELSSQVDDLNLYHRFDELSEVIKVCKVLIEEFDHSNWKDVSLKEANTTMSFINNVIDNNDEAITAFNHDVIQLLLQSGYSIAKQNTLQVNVQESKKDTTTIEDIKAIHEYRNKGEDAVKTSFISNEKEVRKMENTYNNRLETDMEYSIFSGGLVINGDVNVETSLLVKGEVNGNIDSSQHLELKDGAKVTGNIKACEMNLEDGKVIGNVIATGNVFIGEGTYVKGSVSGALVTVEGAVEGDIIASSEISLTGNAQVLGNVKTLLINIEKGAKVSGTFHVGEKETEHSTSNE